MVHFLIKGVPASVRISQDNLMQRVEEAVEVQFSLPWYYWSTLLAAGLFNAVSLSYDSFSLLP